MATAKEEHVHTSNKSSTDKLWESKSNEGASHDRVLIADLQGAEGEVIEGAKGVILPQVKQRFSKTDGKKKKGKEQVHEAFKDLSQEPGSRYLKTASQQPNVSYETDTENHQEWSMKHQQMTTAAKVVAVIVITIITSGTGAGFAAGSGAAAGGAGSTGVLAAGKAALMAAWKAGMVAIQNKVILSTIDNRGNMKGVKREVFSKETAKSVGMSMMAAGLAGGAESATGFSTSNLNGLTQQLTGNLVKAGANAATRLAFGEKPKEVVKSVGIDYVADVASGYAANKIGGWRQGNIFDGNAVDYVLHKGMHVGVGMATRGGAAKAMGKSKREVERAAIGGGIGAGVGEMVGEAKLLAGIRDGSINRTNLDSSMAHISNVSQLAGGVATLFAGQDVDHAVSAARNAVDNNVAFVAPAAVAGGTTAVAIAEGATLSVALAEGAAVLAESAATIAYYGSAILVALGLSEAVNEVKRSNMDAAPDDLTWTDPGVQTEEGKVKILWTPIADQLPGLKGFQPVDHNTSTRDEGFTPHLGPDMSILTMDGKTNQDSNERFWNDPIQFQGNKVYQRDDIFDPKYVDARGRTNLDRMAAGRAPVGVDSESVELHHMIQTKEGPIAEVLQSFHKKNSSTLHINPSTTPSGIDRGEFRKWRESYWKARAKEIN